MKLFERIDGVFHWVTAACFGFMYGQLAFCAIGIATVCALHIMGVEKYSPLYTANFYLSLIVFVVVAIWATPKVYKRQRRGLIL